MTRQLLRADGTILDLDGPVSLDQVAQLIDAQTFDSILLADRVHVMIIDDLGYPNEKPVNERATALYHERCIPGTTWEIRGDVVVVPDSDFAPAGDPFARHSPPL